jgi:hypothetical protein
MRDTRLWDALTLAGAVLLTIGLGLAWFPLALIVPGIAMAALGIYGARVYSRPKRKAEDEEA